MSGNKSIRISVILVLSLFLSSFNILDGNHIAGSDENAAPWMPVTNTPTETATPTYTEIPTETATQTFTDEPTATETPAISATPTFTETLPFTDTPTLTPTQTRTVTETPTVTPTATATSSQTCMGIGTFDDSDANIYYSAGWSSQALSGAYQNTEHYSSVTGSIAEFCFHLDESSTVSIIYRIAPSLGVMNITIDDTYSYSIDQTASNQALKQRWDSPVFEAGNHTIDITHESGTYITLDAIIINDPVGDGIYDDVNSNIFYSSGWNSHAIPGSYANTEHHSLTIGSTAHLTFNLAAPGNVYVYYRSSPDSVMGVLTASIDGGYAYSINQRGSSIYQNKWKSALLTTGVHTLKLSHLSGTVVIIDAIEVDSSPDLNNLHDDADYDITYSEGWYPQDMLNNYQNTEHYSSTIGSIASYSFETTEQTTIALIYRSSPDFGNMNISIDNQEIASISQYVESGTPILRWDSPVLAIGSHTIEITHESGTYITLDAIIINDPVGDGIYDDVDTNIYYSSGWNSHAIPGSYANTEHHSLTIGSTAHLTLNLSVPGNVYVYYRSSPDSVMGVLTASIDGGYAYSINQRGSSIYQNQWKSALLTAGVHTLKLSHFSGDVVIIDAIEVDSSPDLNNFHDDADYDITYSEGWYPQDMLNNYQNTEHYSSTIGSIASYSFETTEQTTIALIYRSSPDFGNMNISIDNQEIASISQYAESGALIQRWDSPVLAIGNHTIEITHESGTYITLDAILINDPVGDGIYDDVDSNIFYSYGWNSHTISGSYANTEHHSLTIDSTAHLTFNLSTPGNVYVYYRSSPSEVGVLTVSIDGADVFSINQLGSSIYQNKWKSDLLTAGVHTLKLSHFSGDVVIIDAIEVDSSSE